MSKRTEKMLADLNAAIQQVANESGSTILQRLTMVEELDSKNKCVPVFMGVIDLWAEFRVAGPEIKMNTEPNGSGLDKLVKIRIQDTLIAIVDLAQSELKKLGVNMEVTL